METDHFHPELIQAIKNKSLVLFVGAGLSYNHINIRDEKLKGWDHLVEKILIHLKESGYDIDHLQSLVGKCAPIKILDLIEDDHKISRTEITDFAKDFFDVKKEDNNFELHYKLHRLSNKIITTNYDTSFEIAAPILSKNKAFKGMQYELTRHKNPDSLLLFKLHGCYEHSDSMIIFNSDYKELYENQDKDAEHALLVLRNIVHNKSILFLGTGMRDFQINTIFSEIKKLQGGYNQKHFIITSKRLDSSLDFLVPIEIEDYHQIETTVDKLLEVKNHFNNEKSKEVVQMEKQLEESQHKIKEYEERLAAKNNEETRKDDLLKREALKYFSEGLELHLEGQLEEACEKYETSIELNDDYHLTYYNWGTALLGLAKLNSGESLYLDSIKKFEKAIALNKGDSDSYCNWAAALSDLGDMNSNASRYDESIEKCKMAIKLNKNDDIAFNNWGHALLGLGQLQEEESIYRKSVEKFKEAIKLNENNHLAYNNLGTALAYIAQSTSDKSLYEESLKNLSKAVDLGGKSYNLSCFYALENEKENALHYLKRSLSNNEIKKEFVLEDSDWVGYLQDPDFIELLKEF